jgi:hypothetical protein
MVPSKPFEGLADYVPYLHLMLHYVHPALWLEELDEIGFHQALARHGIYLEYPIAPRRASGSARAAQEAGWNRLVQAGIDKTYASYAVFVARLTDQPQWQELLPYVELDDNVVRALSSVKQEFGLDSDTWAVWWSRLLKYGTSSILQIGPMVFRTLIMG